MTITIESHPTHGAVAMVQFTGTEFNGLRKFLENTEGEGNMRGMTNEEIQAVIKVTKILKKIEIQFA